MCIFLYLQIEDVEALLAGRTPQGRPVDPPAAANGSNGADSSKACVIQ